MHTNKEIKTNLLQYIEQEFKKYLKTVRKWNRKCRISVMFSFS